jgi:hypothetical protein
LLEAARRTAFARCRWSRGFRDFHRHFARGGRGRGNRSFDRARLGFRRRRLGATARPRLQECGETWIERSRRFDGRDRSDRVEGGREKRERCDGDASAS